MRWLCLAVLLVSVASAADEEPRAPDLHEPPPYDEFLIVPLRVHLLSARDADDIDCRLGDGDVTRVLGKMNGVWHKAGIHWGLESLRREPAARIARYKLARELAGPENLAIYRILTPDDSRSFDGQHVYFIHRFAVNGVWLGDGIAFVQDTAALKRVEGGSDEPLPRVIAHELGHALDLSHRQNRTNLLASGTTGILLNTDEVRTARAAAKRLPGARTVAALRAAAEAAEARGDRATALRYWKWLAEIPGTGREHARANVERLDTRK